MSKRILIITYYWPPAGGAGVQRWLKFVKYLPNFDWTPVVYTVKNGEFPVLDYSLGKDVPEGVEVIRRKIIEPYSWYKKFMGQKPEEKINAGFLTQTEKPKKKENLARWIRGNLFIPDARKFWIHPSIRFLTRYLSEHPVDIIVSTGPPHSMHLIALGLKKKLNIPWMADFRDPWTKIDFYQELRLTRWADRKHHRQENKVLRHADKTITVSWGWAEELKSLGADKVEVITNGYDNEDFSISIKPDSAFSIVHLGSIFKDRNPALFWKAISEILAENQDFKKDLKIYLVGAIDISVIQSINQYSLNNFTEIINYLEHPKAISYLKKSQILLLLLNANVKGIIPGKLFEYLASERPIFAIGNTTGDTSRILQETHTGRVADYSDFNKIKATLLDLYMQYKSGGIKINPEHLENYTRKKLTEDLADLFNNLSKTEK